MYRPIIEVTNTNPDVLRVEKVEKLKGAPQFFQLLLAPTGFKKGVAVITVRSLVTSVHCAHSSSVTFIVLCHRDVGRRLHVEYPYGKLIFFCLSNFLFILEFINYA